MYTNKIVSAISILLALSTSILNVEAQLKGKYPLVDKPPPVDATWTALVDQSKLIKAPLRVPGQCNPVDTYCVWSCTNCLRTESDVQNCPDKKDWALTYDDGPSNNSLTVLDALDARGIKATFFAIGSRVYENPQILKKIVDSGHQIGVHTWSHTPLTSQSTEQIIAEVKWTEQAIKEAVNLTPKWFRPPQGDFDDRVRGILTQLGYKIAIWDSDTFDWHSVSDPTYDLAWIPGNFSVWVQNTTSTVGHISLEHDLYEKTASKAAEAMDIVMKAKFNVQSLSVCLGDAQPYAEQVTLPKSNPIGQDGNGKSQEGNGKSPKGNNGKTPAEKPPVISANGSNSIKNDALLSIVYGLMMMLGIIYI